jgi:hypothetical protein
LRKNTLTMLENRPLKVTEPIGCDLINIATTVDILSALQFEARQELDLDLELLASLHFNVAIPLTIGFWRRLRILVFGQRLTFYQDPDVDLIDHWHVRREMIVEICEREVVKVQSETWMKVELRQS